MPSSATITSFYNFIANTKARASQINNNFDVIRGHFIPIHVSTATSANNTYDLGSSEYRWKSIYGADISLGVTSTSWKIADSTTTNDTLLITQNGTNKFAISKTPSATTTAAIGQFARSSLIADFDSGSSTTSFTISVTGSTCTISTVGRPIICGLGCFDATTGGSQFETSEALSGGSDFGATLNILRDGVIIGQHVVFMSYQTADINPTIYIPSNITIIDFPSNGTYNYSLSITTRARSKGRILNSRSFAFEL